MERLNLLELIVQVRTDDIDEGLFVDLPKKSDGAYQNDHGEPFGVSADGALEKQNCQNNRDKGENGDNLSQWKPITFNVSGFFAEKIGQVKLDHALNGKSF